MVAKVYPMAVGPSPSATFEVNIESWVSGDLSTQLFNIKLSTEGEFQENVTPESGNTAGLSGARKAIGNKVEEKNAAAKVGKLAGLVAGIGLVGVAVGFLAKHQHGKAEVKDLKTRLTVSERRNTLQGGEEDGKAGRGDFL